MKRPNLDLPAPVVGWIYNHSRKNYWRVAAWYDIDDLIHDGLVCAYKCREEYGTDLDPKHFASLVRTTFYNHIGELIRKKRAVDDPSVGFADIGNWGGVQHGRQNVAQSEAEGMDKLRIAADAIEDIGLMIAEMPAHLRKAVTLLLNSPEKFRRLRQRLDGTVETLSEKLGQLVGWDVSKDFETELRAYIWEREHGIDTDSEPVARCE